MNITGSTEIINALIRENVSTIFGYPGGAIMPFYDALYGYRDKIHHILVRHEQGAAMAAIGYARTTLKTGVCIATSGPGATNLITGIADAMMDSVPIVCITGQVASHLLGTDAFQESDILGMTIPVTKWSYQITKASEISGIFSKAFATANSGRPGPVLIDITKNAQIELLSQCYINSFSLKNNETNLSHNDYLIGEAAKLLNNAKKPLILTGHGVLISQAENELLKLAEITDSAVCSTLLGLSSFPCDHKLYKGMLGMHGNYGANKLSNSADVVLAVGMRFDDRVTGDINKYLYNSKIIHIEIDNAEINKNIIVDVPINDDAKITLNKIIPKLENRKHPKWHQMFDDLKKEEYTSVTKNQIYPKSNDLTMAEVINQVSNKTKGNAIIVSDVGQHQMITALYYKFLNPNSHISSGGLGTMGFALPTAIGAKIGNPDKTVIMVAGDGGFQMNIQELMVLQQEGINLKMLVLNNNYLGMVRQWQELFFDNRFSFTNILSPNLQKIAEAYGILGKKVTKRCDLDKSLDEFLTSDSSYLLEVIVEQQGNVFPMVPTGESVENVRLK